MTIPNEDQYSGCLIGQCLGDALGVVVEGYPPDACSRYVTEILKKGKAGEQSRGPFPFGQYSDDSQLARELLQSYVECGEFDASDYAKRIAAIFAESRIVGYGRATRDAAYRLIQGVPWDEAGTPPPSAGNGTAMRAAPIGLIFFDDTDKLAQAAHDQGRITHKDSRCSAGAVVIAGAVASLLRGESTEPDSLLTRLARLAHGFDASLASAMEQLIDWVALQPKKAVEPISKVGVNPDYSDGWEGISPFVTSSVLWSVYSFLRTPEDYWETICTAIAVGGDVDTTAAMAGAISGAHLGLSSIPKDLASRLTDQGTWGLDELVQLSHDCMKVKHGEASL